MTNTETRWGFLAPVLQTVPVEHLEDFLRHAPAGTVVDVDGEVSKRFSYSWVHVEEIDGVDEWREHSRSNPVEMLHWCETRVVTVLKLGEE